MATCNQVALENNGILTNCAQKSPPPPIWKQVEELGMCGIVPQGFIEYGCSLYSLAQNGQGFVKIV